MKVAIMESLGISAEELAARKAPFEAQGVVVGDDLVDAILGGVEVGTML